MGFFGDNRKQLAADADRRAAKADGQARKAAAEAAKYRKALKDSTDPAADQYMIRQAERDQRIAEANARDERDSAKRLRRIW